jgi:1,2-diacylglycerol 3-alpha-glucosyltransferase
MDILKVAIIFHQIGPYHHARLNAIGRSLDIVGIQWSERQIYSWGDASNISLYKKISLFNYTHWNTHNCLSLFYRLFKVLKSIRPNLMVINGWNDFGSLISIYCCWLRNISIIIMSESHEKDEVRKWWKEAIKAWILNFASGVLVGGKAHREYLLKLGVTPNKIFMGYDVINNDTFHPNAIKSLHSPLNKPFFLAINRFVPKKNLLFLLSAYAKYLQKVNQVSAWHLVLCGDGEMRSQIEQKIHELGIQDHVILTGFLQQAGLLPYFAHAKCFIHASIQEQWGLVVNEAMAAGLPVLVSNRCGCYEDLLIEEVNGFGFDPENELELTNLMLKMSSGDIDLEKMGNASLTHIQKFSPDYFAHGLKEAIAFAMNKS